MPLLRGISQPFSRLFQSRLTKMICVYGLMEKERQKQTLHSPHSPVSILTPEDWFLHFLMVWHCRLTVCAEWEVLSAKRKEFSVCTVQARDYKLGKLLILGDFDRWNQNYIQVYSPLVAPSVISTFRLIGKKTSTTTTTKRTKPNDPANFKECVDSTGRKCKTILDFLKEFEETLRRRQTGCYILL